MVTLAEAAQRLRAGETSAARLVEDALAAIARDQPRTNAFIRVDADSARADARTVDADRARGIDRGPLHGIPISLKDLIDEAGRVTTAGSRALADRVAPADATVVTRLRAAGAILIGKTNLHEFALGTTSEDSAFGAVHNPHDPARSAGGSSGGSAAAVACGMGLASIGSDTGGSIRIPAAACGVVGLKPSLGEVPTDGVIPLSSTFDHVGPLTNSVDDAAIVWAVIAGRDAHATLDHIRGAHAARARPRRLVRVRGYLDSPVAPEVRHRVDAALAQLARDGWQIADAEIPSARGILEAYVNVVLPEGAAWHSRYLDARAAHYSPIVRARFESGRSISAVAYLQALEFCRALRREVDHALGDADALVLPTLPITAPLLGSDEVTIDPAVGDRTPVRSAMLKHTQPFNMTGHPAISIPINPPGLKTQGSIGAATETRVFRPGEPVGLQLVGHLGRTTDLLAVAGACEKIIRNA